LVYGRDPSPSTFFSDDFSIRAELSLLTLFVLEGGYADEIGNVEC